ncbi:hypothetical protein TNCT_704461 [Trichonephila clavata]|uniref:Uncharacterized protein n=1 Tax=Trichonephila clavata TaxID=2740835 RepID=A0A8X6H399_TRICU|nr:hypothetical protein TNCT_704461 [Trichonephila clavata]
MTKEQISVGNRIQLDNYIVDFAMKRRIYNISAGFMRITHKQNFIQMNLKGAKRIYFEYQPQSRIIFCLDRYPEHHEHDRHLSMSGSPIQF